MIDNHRAYIIEATRLRQLYASRIKILVGFECEWIRQSDLPFIKSLAADPAIDLFLGSVHHVHEIPIDFDRPMYEKAREEAGGTDERLFEDYFDSQYDMLHDLRPPVVAHFDLIRLYSDNKDTDLKSMPGVWKKVVRNLDYCARQGLMIEINSSALRKGLKEPYPGCSVCEACVNDPQHKFITNEEQEFLKMDGKFTLSDDSHGLGQVGLNFQRVQEYLLDNGINEVWYFDRDANGDLVDRSVRVDALALAAYPSTL